ncbi:MAG: hypothetical protein LH660_21585 [Phormidesmis sp. CAN_BIN36]|nr:hypothetical protein [Phormidesmis sp. CAN_BIN36]
MAEETLLRKFLPKEVIDGLPDALKQDLEEALRGMNEYRNKYKGRIKTIYQNKQGNNQLFLTQIDGDMELAQQHNLKELVNLAAHCIVIGDREMLDIFVIRPLQEGRSGISIEDVEAYCYSLSRREQAGTTPEQEKTYLRILVKELRTFVQHPTH